MGHIKKVLDLKELPPRSITANMIWTDLCENVHLHYRNLRIDYSEVEFAGFRCAMNHLGMAVEHVANEYKYKEGDPNFLVQQQFNTPLETDSDYYPDRALIELQRDNTVHFHYRDLRLHFSLAEFEIIAKMFTDALDVQQELKDIFWEDRMKEIKEKKRQWMPINRIQPYDEGHRPGVFDAEHRKGIDYCKGLMKELKKIRPILVTTNGQRLDGFKRYMAHLELGHTEIECIIDPFGQMGGQHNQSMIDDNEMGRCQKTVDKCDNCGFVALTKSEGATMIRWECEKCGAWNEPYNYNKEAAI